MAERTNTVHEKMTTFVLAEKHVLCWAHIDNTETLKDAHSFAVSRFLLHNILHIFRFLIHID